MPTNWKKVYALKKQATETLKKVLPSIKNESGIYILLRKDESGLDFGYVGQAVKLEDRLASHLIGYSQRIDISLKKRGFYDREKRPYGWRLNIIYCGEDTLDEMEQKTILECASNGIQLYNRTSGSQGKGKIGINDGQSTKGYRDGLSQGRKNTIKEVKTYFDKYLDYSIKGQPNKIKERKLKEFGDLLNENLQADEEPNKK